MSIKVNALAFYYETYRVMGYLNKKKKPEKTSETLNIRLTEKRKTKLFWKGTSHVYLRALLLILASLTDRRHLITYSAWLSG